MFDLELFVMQLQYNNKIRRILKKMRSAFAGRTDEAAVKIIALCDKIKTRMDNEDEKDGVTYNLLSRQAVSEDILKEYEEICGEMAS